MAQRKKAVMLNAVDTKMVREICEIYLEGAKYGFNKGIEGKSELYAKGIEEGIKIGDNTKRRINKDRMYI